MHSRHPALLLLLPLIVGSFAPGTAGAECDVVAECIPQPTCPYVSTNGTDIRESPTRITAADLRNPTHCEPPPGSGNPVDSFFDIDWSWDSIAAPGAPVIHRKGSTTATIRIMPPTPEGFIDIEVLSLTMAEAADSVRVRESPTKPSIGRQVATPNPGGGLHIDSFFDVFFELSVDGGQTWAEAVESMEMRLTQEQPTPAQAASWGTLKAIYR